MREPSWDIVEMVRWGLERREEAERRGAEYISVMEIHPDAERMSSRVEECQKVVHLLKKLARERGTAFIVLRRMPGFGWILDDYFRVVGDRITVNAAIAELTIAFSAGAAP